MNDEQEQGHVPHSTTPPYPRKVRLWVFLVLPAMNGPLPAELKFKQNTAIPFGLSSYFTHKLSSAFMITFYRKCQ